jgi:hypothetical protein
MAGEVLACASCGGSLNTDWQNLDYTFTPGLKIDFRYDFLDQNQLRSGNGTISPAAASKRVNANGPQEVEQYTRNNYLTLGLDYTPNINWGIDLQAPYIIRSHSTLGTNSDGTTAGPGGGQYNFSSANLGDLKVIGRYQGLTEKHNLGLLFGFKLATGSYTETGNSTDPTAPGPAPIDRGLQPGSGTTDVIVGAYYNNAINHYLGYFTLATYQAALYSTDSYRPGNSLNATAGVRYVGFVYVIPQIQFNFHNSQRDTGAMADNISTGGSQLYISPGIVAAASDRVSLYSFVQVPVYQYVNGVQLAPRFTVSAGVRYAF